MDSNTLRTAAIALLFAAPSLSSAQAAGDKKTIAIICTKTGAGPNLTAQANTLVTKELKKSANIVPTAKITKATKKLKIKAKDLGTPASAKSIGAEVAATHVVVIEGVAENEAAAKGKGKKVFAANVSVVNVATGDVAFTAKYPLKNKKLDAKMVAQLAAEVTAALNPAVAPAETPPAATPPAEAPPAPPAPPESPPPPATSEATPPPAGDNATPAAAPAPAPAPATEAQPTPAPAPEATAAASPPPAEQPAAAPAPSEEDRGGWRPALELDVGGIGMQRTATFSAGGSPPSYKGPAPGATLRLNFYPLAIGGTGKFYEGIGLFVDGSFLLVSTMVTGVSTAAKSNVMQGNGGLAVRIVFGSSAGSPDLTVKGGYSYFDFPLAAAMIFPGIRYAGPIVGGQLTIPFVPQFGLVVGGNYGLGLKASGAAAREVGTFSKASSFRVEAGVQIVFAPLEIRLLGRYEKFSSSYTGAPPAGSLLAGDNINDATISDTYLGGFGTIGVQF